MNRSFPGSQAEERHSRQRQQYVQNHRGTCQPACGRNPKTFGVAKMQGGQKRVGEHAGEAPGELDQGQSCRPAQEH